MELNLLIKRIKSKKELHDLDENFLKARINEYNLENLDERTKAFKLKFKELRKRLREVYGVFRQVKETRDLEVYKKIFNETHANIVLDLGCGLEPLRYTKLAKLTYYCLDISKNDVKSINNHFKANNIKGEAFLFSLIDNNLANLPKVDLCLALKLLESLEAIKFGISKQLLQEIKAKYILVSFSKKSLAGKKIRKAGRSWFRKLLKELSYSYEIFDYGNEIFFIIRR